METKTTIFWAYFISIFGSKDLTVSPTSQVNIVTCHNQNDKLKNFKNWSEDLCLDS